MKKILMSVAVGMFMLSGISLVLLTIEDKKDLSGRAYEIVDSEYAKILADLQKNKKGGGWTGQLTGIGAIQLSLNPETWEAVDLEKMVFYNRVKDVTIQIVSKDMDLKTVLGNNYTHLNKEGQDTVEKWNGTLFGAIFIGKPRAVQSWINPDKGWQVVTVSRKKVDQETAVEILGQIDTASADKLNVKGETTTDDSSKLATISRPSVVMILTKYCTMLRVGKNEPDPQLAGKVYPFCLAGTGSGFFINPDGYIATNGHVVKMLDTVVIVYAGIVSGRLDNFIIDSLISAARQTGTEPDMEKIKTDIESVKQDKQSSLQLALTIDALVKQSMLSIDSGKYNYYAQTGNKAITLSETGAVATGDGVMEATLVGSDYEPMDEDGNFKSSDVAILKVQGKGFPALPIGEITNLAPGAGLEVIGFPGLAMGGQQSSLLDASSNSEPTVTRGVVSAIKQAKGDMKKLIQTDASITHGNSGGPALNNTGQVVGIATYGLTADGSSGNYNFLRDIGDLRALAAKYNVELKTGQTYDKWKVGLESYWLSYYKYAKSDFESVTSEYPTHPTADTFVKQAAAKVGTKADLTPRFSKTQRSMMMTVAAIVMALSLLTMGGTALSGIFGRNTAKVYAQPSNPGVSEPQQQTAPPPSPQPSG